MCQVWIGCDRCEMHVVWTSWTSQLWTGCNKFELDVSGVGCQCQVWTGYVNMQTRHQLLRQKTAANV